MPRRRDAFALAIRVPSVSPLKRWGTLATLPRQADTGRVMRMSAFVAALAGIASLVCGCGGSVDDPASAACPRPPVTIGATHALGDHLEAPVHFACSGSKLAGTLYLPASKGQHAAVVWLHGSGAAPLAEAWVRRHVRG